MFSNSSVAKEERVTRLNKTEIAIDDIKEFVTVVYEGEWWLGCVVLENQDDKIVSINSLIPHGPSQSYKYPVKERIITVSTDDVLTIVDPRTSSRRAPHWVISLFFAVMNDFECFVGACLPLHHLLASYAPDYYSVY